MQIIGRKREIKELQRLKESSQAEFVAIYGRRRVGKTTLFAPAHWIRLYRGSWRDQKPEL